MNLDYIITEPPKVFGLFHIACILIVIAICVILGVKYKNPTEKGLNRTLLIFGLIMLVLEIYKELTYILYFDADTGTYKYSWYAFPFQFCSTPMYILLIAPFVKNKKVKDCMLSFLACFSVFGGLCVLIYPEQVFISRLGITIQSMLHHSCQIIVGSFLISSGVVKLNKETLLHGSYVFFVLLIMALTMNIVVYNFDLLPGHTFNMFYVGPYYECTLPLVSLLWPNEFTLLKYILFLMIYIIGFVLASGVVLIFAYLIKKCIYKIMKH